MTAFVGHGAQFTQHSAMTLQCRKKRGIAVIRYPKFLRCFFDNWRQPSIMNMRDMGKEVVFDLKI